MRRVLKGSGPLGASRKPDGSLLTACDLALQSAIEEMLHELGFPHPLLGEEMTPEAQRRIARAEAYWCLDPLDGTSNFAAGVPLYGTSLAYISSGSVEFGLVYDPVRDECFHASRGGGAFHNGARMTMSLREKPLARDVACVDFKRLPRALASALAQVPPYASQRSLGACVIEWCWTALGRFGLYLHGGQRLWDYAAGALILLEAGGVVESLDGIAWHGEVRQGDVCAKRSIVAASAEKSLDAWHEWNRQLIGT